MDVRFRPKADTQVPRTKSKTYSALLFALGLPQIEVRRAIRHCANMRPAQGNEVRSILNARDGRLTVATLTSGRVFSIKNIAWGRDDGAEFDHITTNISPEIIGYSIDFFHTSEVRELADDEGSVLFRA